jgi:hypothetical protein
MPYRLDSCPKTYKFNPGYKPAKFSMKYLNPTPTLTRTTAKSLSISQLTEIPCKNLDISFFSECKVSKFFLKEDEMS